MFDGAEAMPGRPARGPEVKLALPRRLRSPTARAFQSTLRAPSLNYIALFRG